MRQQSRKRRSRWQLDEQLCIGSVAFFGGFNRCAAEIHFQEMRVVGSALAISQLVHVI
jgi:hypothetical protein